MKAALNGISTMPYPFLMDVRVGRETGYDGLLMVGAKLRRYLFEGFTVEQAVAALDGFPVLGLGSVQDIERSSSAGRASLFAECEEMCRLASAIGCSMVQLLTGPLDPTGSYQDPLHMDSKQLRKATAANLVEIGAIGRQFGVGFYLEPLVWTPLRTLAAALQVLDDAGQENVGLAIDFWHLWNAGTDPEVIARIEGGLIRCVDLCDAIGPPGSLADADQRGRRIWTGAGSIPLQVWVDAVLATGFDGVWSCELLSPQHWELDPWTTARDLRQLLGYLFT